MPSDRRAPEPASPSPAQAPPAAHDPSPDIERLFRDHNDALLRFIAAKLGSTQEAKEIAQEAYVRLLSLDHREAVSYLRAFLFKTAANLATDRLRQRARRGWLVTRHDVNFAPFELSPERQIEGEQAMEQLRTAIDELPDKCREAFLLYRLDGLTCQQVATRLGLQERMVWVYIARALEYLRSRLERLEGHKDAQGAKP